MNYADIWLPLFTYYLTQKLYRFSPLSSFLFFFVSRFHPCSVTSTTRSDMSFKHATLSASATTSAPSRTWRLTTCNHVRRVNTSCSATIQSYQPASRISLTTPNDGWLPIRVGSCSPSWRLWHFSLSLWVQPCWWNTAGRRDPETIQPIPATRDTRESIPTMTFKFRRGHNNFLFSLPPLFDSINCFFSQSTFLSIK